MEPDRSGNAFILAKHAADATPGATLRYSDAAGPTAAGDPRLREQLEIITGRRLSQFSMAGSGIRIAFWGEETGSIGREILIEHATLELTAPGHAATTFDWNNDVVATSLLSALDHKVTRIDLTDGYLSVDSTTTSDCASNPTSTTSPGRSAQTTTY